MTEDIRENPNLQYFLCLSANSYKQPFTPSLFVSIRRRLGEQAFKELSGRFMEHVHQVEQKMASKEPGLGKDASTDE